MNRSAQLLLPVLAALAATPALAIENAACTLQSTSYLDSLINPVEGGDEDFFTTSIGVPNVSLLIDSSGSMTEWPRQFQRCGTGCACAELDDLGYDPAIDNEPEWQNVNSETRHTDLFNKNKVYSVPHGLTSASHGWPRDYGWGTTPLGPSWTGADRTAAIAAACGDTDTSRNVPDVAACKTCLATKGYYLVNTNGVGNMPRSSDVARRRMVGNFLNFYSPRYVMARRVMKEVIKDIRRVRMNLLSFGSSGDTPYELTPFNPACNQSDPTTNGSSFDSNRQSVVSKFEDIRFDRGNTPLARALLGAGYSFSTVQSGYTNPIRAALGSDWDDDLDIPTSSLAEGGSQNQKAICNSCVFSAIILVTDGEPNDGRDDSIPVIGESSRELVWPDCPNCRDTDLDEVAKFLWTNDLRPDHAREQRVATYTVAFGLDPTSWAQTLLRHTADVGGGQFYSAYTSGGLKNALLSIFDNINTRNTSFSSSTMASLQTGTESLTAIMPRMSPRRDEPWRGSLYRFGLWNEFVRRDMSADPPDPGDHPNDGPEDLDYDDIYIVDQDGSIVVEDSDGNFKKKGTDTPALYDWEAGEKLRQAGHATRKIYTVIDRDGNGVLNQSDNPPVEFKKSNVDLLINYLGVRGAPFCPTSALTADRGRFLEKLNLTVVGAATAIGVSPPSSTPTAAELDRLCAQVLIEYIRGQDLADENRDNNRTDTRLSVLGDIFHSSPMLVTPPVGRWLCDLGLSSQCVLTLYGYGDSETPATTLANYVEQPDPGEEGQPCNPAGTTITRHAYDKWRFDNRTRERLILVGANDGMLHAFNDGRSSFTCDTATNTVVSTLGGSSGQEEWAFIPPDLLARLREHPFGHAYYVDADTMVRDIWADANGNGLKEHDEFHTVAVGAEGRGGTHYFGLGLRFDVNGNAVAPEFRWIFPQPDSPEAALFGKTLNALSPKPPAIGPVLLNGDVSNGGFPASETPDRHGSPSVERWVVMVGGGWSPGGEKGRGVYMLDAWNGNLSSVTGRTDNLLWKWEFSPAASGPQQGTRRHMTHGVAAPVAMVDYGSGEYKIDGFFDTAVVGDLGGQLWVFRFFEPGKRATAGVPSGWYPTSGLISNWSGGRGFEMDRDGSATSGTDEDGSAQIARSILKKSPFYYLASTTAEYENNSLRAFIGTGNRYAILDAGLGTCRFDNPLACAKANCDDVKVEYRINRLNQNVTKAETHWKDLRYAHSKLEMSAATNPACGTVGGTVVTAEIAAHTVTGCDVGTSPGTVRQTKVTCGLTATDAFSCRKDTTRPAENYGDIPVTPSSTTLAQLGRNRYFGVWIYGGLPDRTFSESQVTSGLTSAEQFDQRRLTDRTASDPAGGDLKDVTGVTCNGVGPDAICTCPAGTGEVCFAGAGDWGWHYEYDGMDRKTASGSSVLASCVMWNDMAPGAATTVCDPAGAPNGRLYQAHYITGAPNCAAGLKDDAGTVARFQQRDGLISPPPEPATAIQVNKQGQVRYSTLLVEPGQEDGVTNINVGSNADVLRLVYELPVTPELHDCRHTAKGCITK